jgi:hypothetical protein
MTDPTLQRLRELRPEDADRVHEIFTAAQRAAGLEAILATGSAQRLATVASADSFAGTRGHRRRRLGSDTAVRRVRRPLLASAVATGGVAVALVAFAGVVSDQGPTGASPAQAAVLRGALRALRSGPGTILVEADTYFTRGAGGHQWSQRQGVIYQTPVGAGAQNFLTSEGPGSTETSTINGTTQDWDPTTNTIYTNVGINPCGCKITRGPAAGTYRVALLPTPGAPRRSAAWEQNQHLPPPLTITIRQAQSLRDGADSIMVEPVTVTNRRSDATGPWKMKITAAYRVPSDTSATQAALKHHQLTVEGLTTVDGRFALKLATPAGSPQDPSTQYYVDPGTYAPIKNVFHSGGDLTIITFHRYEVLPDTLRNRKLLNLTSRHPTARIDNSHADYLKAETQLSNDSRKP